MLRRLKCLYPNAILSSDPHDISLGQFYVFGESSKHEWIGIPKEDLSEKEVSILKTIYELIEPHQLLAEAPPLTGSWYEFLFSNGPLPDGGNGLWIRFIQFQLKGNPVEKLELESALKGIFSQEILILWRTSYSGVVIERNQSKEWPFSAKELSSVAEILENDFYISPAFYYGKQYSFSSELREFFHEEKAYFTFAQNMLKRTKFFTYEKVFPAYMAFHLPEQMKVKLIEPFAAIFKEDPEIFLTIKIFLENNLNASLTAKKLFIHRNTLQYRLDKFSEKTGIQLKDFYGAFTVFLACLVFAEMNQQ